MKNTSQLALELQESDYCTFSLGIFSTWLLSLFCLFCIKIRPRKTSKTNSKYTYFPPFVTYFLSWVFGLKPIISTICQKQDISDCVVNSDTYLSLPSETDLVGWHRDGAFQLNTESIKIKITSQNYKFFIYLKGLSVTIDWSWAFSRKKIYKDSVGVWKNYENNLKEFFQKLPK